MPPRPIHTPPLLLSPLRLTTRLLHSKFFLYSFVLVIFLIYSVVASILVYQILFVSRWNLIEPSESKFEWPNECPITLVSSLRATEMRSNPMRAFFRLKSCIVLFAPQSEHKLLRKQWEDASYDSQSKIHYGSLVLQDLDVEHDVKQWKLFPDVLASVQLHWELRRQSMEEQERVAVEKALLLLKPSFLQKAMEQDPHQSKYFFWMDADYAADLFSKIPQGTSWPDTSKIHDLLKTKNSLFMVNLQDTDVLSEYCTESRRLKAHDISSIAAGFFGGNKDAVQELHKYFESVSSSELTNRLLSDEETILHLAWCQKPSLFMLYKCPVARFCEILRQHPCWDSYTCPAFMLQESHKEVDMDPLPGALKLYITGHSVEWGLSLLRGVVILFLLFCVVIPSVALFVRKWYWNQRQWGLLADRYYEIPDLYELDQVGGTTEEELEDEDDDGDTPLGDGDDWR